MSFSADTKKEIISSLDFKQNLKPFVFSIIEASKEIFENSISFICDNEEIYKIFLKIFSRSNLENAENFMKINEEYKIGNKVFYKIEFDKNFINNFFGVDISLSTEENYNSIIKNIEDIKMFCKGAYIGTATSSIKISNSPENKTTSGYHLEFDSKHHEYLINLSNYLASFDISPKIIKRKNYYVLYIKDAEQVSDTLALVGAFSSVVALQNEIVKREFRNKINRQTNCESGNITKLVSASMKQIAAIEKINESIGLSSLDPELEEVAILRLANPEESLTDLLKLSTLKLTKSGLNHRLRKIIAIADNLTWFII